MDIQRIHKTIEAYKNGKISSAAAINIVNDSLSASNCENSLVSGSLSLNDISDLLSKAHEHLAKSGLTQKEYVPISWALVDAREIIMSLICGNDH